MKQLFTPTRIARILFLLLCIILGNATAKAQDTQETISLIELTSADFTVIPQYGNNCTKPKFTVTTGSPAFVSSGNSNWYSRQTDYPVGDTDVFTAGSYFYRLYIFITGENAKKYKLAPYDELVVKVNGEAWKVESVGNFTPVETGDRYQSQARIVSPDITITKPEGDPLIFSIPSSFYVKPYLNKPIDPISLADYTSGGEKPYTFSKVSGPDWVNVSSDGKVTGTPTVAETNDELVVKVTDNAGNERRNKIPFDATTLDPADREKITEMEATSSDYATIPKYGNYCSYVTFTVTKGSPAHIETTMGSWRKKVGDEWVFTEPADIFTAGTYHYEVQIRVDGEAGMTHVLGEGFTFKMNGESWTVNNSNFVVKDTYSYLWVYGPEVVITEPVGEPLTFTIPTTSAIEKNYKGKAITEVSVAAFAFGGEKPYTFSKVSGPEWITVSSEGVIAGTPTEIGTNSDLVIRVTDKAGNYKESTMTVGETVANPEDKIDVTLVEATCEDLTTIPGIGKNCSRINLTITSGSPAYYSKDNSIWYTVVNNRLTEGHQETDQFTAGTYIYMAYIIISGNDNKTHKLASNVKLKVNGTEWRMYGNVYYEDNRSYAYFYSPFIDLTDTGIDKIGADGKPAVRYNLKGQRVDEHYKGVVIINGKKVVVK
ncbi:MAG: hypothetical protein ILA07_06290 [Prevotella sp.]|nr:hypothetical protein [Prevotella sp.]